MRARSDSLAAAVLPSIALAAVMYVCSVPAEAAGQVVADYRISQHASVMQTLAGTTIEVTYSRPGARGRSPIFGRVVHWGEVWTPGANEATVLEVSDTVEVEGVTVPAGRWSMWLIPSQVGNWEMLLDPRDSLFHTMRPEVGGESQIRFPVEPKTVEPVELLTWSFPEATRNTATLQLAWGTTAVPLHVRARAEMPVITVPPEQAAAYAGEWEINFVQSPGGPGAPLPPPAVMTLRYDEAGQHLVMELPPGIMAPPQPAAAEVETDALSPIERERQEAREKLAADEEALYELVLVPRSPELFLLGFIEKDGTLLDIEQIFHEFEFEGGRAVRLTIRGPDDTLFARVERKR